MAHACVRHAARNKPLHAARMLTADAIPRLCAVLTALTWYVKIEKVDMPLHARVRVCVSWHLL